MELKIRTCLRAREDDVISLSFTVMDGWIDRLTGG